MRVSDVMAQEDITRADTDSPSEQFKHRRGCISGKYIGAKAVKKVWCYWTSTEESPGRSRLCGQLVTHVEVMPALTPLYECVTMKHVNRLRDNYLDSAGTSTLCCWVCSE